MGDNSKGIIFGLVVCVAAFFLTRRFFPSLSTLLLVLGGIAVLLLVLLVAVVMFFALRKPKGEEGKPAVRDTTEILSAGRANLMEIRRLAMKIGNKQIKDGVEEICKEADKILKALREQPEDIGQVRQTLNYFLPTLITILTKYGRMEGAKALTPELTENTIASLVDIRTALEKQYKNLFEDDMLDLTVEMEVLAAACKRDGLTLDNKS